MAQTTRHNTTLSIVKAICIMLMVVGHTNAPVWLKDFIYLFHMPCFFIISGYFISDKHIINIKETLIKKTKKIWFYAFKWSIIFILFHNLFASIHFVKDYISLTDILKRVLIAFKIGYTSELIGGFWFLADLFFVTIISLLIINFVRRKFPEFNVYKYLWILILTVLAFGGVITNFFEKIPLLNRTVLLSWSYLLLGIYSREWLCKTKFLDYINRNSIPLGILGILIICIGSVYFKADMNCGGWDYAPYFFISVIGSLSVIWISSLLCSNNYAFSRKSPKVLSLLDFIGTESLVILTLHGLSFKLINYSATVLYLIPTGEFTLNPDLELWIECPWYICATAGIALPVIIKYWTKKLVANRDFQKISKPAI